MHDSRDAALEVGAQGQHQAAVLLTRQIALPERPVVRMAQVVLGQALGLAAQGADAVPDDPQAGDAVLADRPLPIDMGEDLAGKVAQVGDSRGDGLQAGLAVDVALQAQGGNQEPAQGGQLAGFEQGALLGAAREQRPDVREIQGREALA